MSLAWGFISKSWTLVGKTCHLQLTKNYITNGPLPVLGGGLGLSLRI